MNDAIREPVMRILDTDFGGKKEDWDEIVKVAWIEQGNPTRDLKKKRSPATRKNKRKISKEDREQLIVACLRNHHDRGDGNYNYTPIDGVREMRKESQIPSTSTKRLFDGLFVSLDKYRELCERRKIVQELKKLESNELLP